MWSMIRCTEGLFSVHFFFKDSVHHDFIRTVFKTQKEIIIQDTFSSDLSASLHDLINLRERGGWGGRERQRHRGRDRKTQKARQRDKERESEREGGRESVKVYVIRGYAKTNPVSPKTFFPFYQVSDNKCVLILHISTMKQYVQWHNYELSIASLIH